MANNTGYEALYVDRMPRGPTSSMVKEVACAIFYIDPSSKARAVRYRADQYVSPLTASKFSPPTAMAGVPLRRGKSIVVAGDANIRHSLFVAESESAIVHCFYYDRVDVVDMGLGVDQDLLEVAEDILKVMKAIDVKLDALMAGYVTTERER